MRLGLNYVPVHSSPEEWAEILSSKGYRAASFPADYRTPVSLIDAYVRAAQSRDIKIAEVGIWNSPHGTDAQTARQVCLEQFRLAEYVRAVCCVNVSGAAGERWCGCYAENFTEKLYSEHVDFIRSLCDTVKPRYTVYALEPMQWMVPDSPEQYLQFIKDVDRPGFAAHMDIVNFIKDPFTYTHTDELINRAFDLLSPYIKSCHLKDCRMDEGITVAIREVPAGEGIVNHKVYLDRINRLDPEMPVLLEHLPDMTAFNKAFDYVRGITV